MRSGCRHQVFVRPKGKRREKIPLVDLVIFIFFFLSFFSSFFFDATVVGSGWGPGHTHTHTQEIRIFSDDFLFLPLSSIFDY